MRKATLASILRKSRPGVRLNEYLEHPEGALGVQVGRRGDCVAAPGLAVQVGSFARLAEAREPGGACGEAGGGRGLELISRP